MEEKHGKGEGAGSSSSKKKKVYNVEPRTPLKRQRVPVQRFQSPAEELAPPPKAKTPKEEVELVYKRGTFLAVRGAEGTFYLCRTQQNVFQNTKHFKIQWLDQNQNTKVYKFDFLDHTEIECVLTNVRMDYVAREQYSLPDSEKERVEMILTKALKKEKGEPIDDIIGLNQTKDEEEEEEEEEEVEEDDEDEDWEDEPTPKKKKVSAKSKKSITVSLKAGKNPGSSKKQPAKGKSQAKKKEPKSAEKKKQGKRKSTEKTERKRGPDRHLKPNLKIKILEKDPLFETKDHVPFISKYAHQRLVFRAVNLKDTQLLKQLLEDGQHIHHVDAQRSTKDGRGPVELAIENNDIEIMNLLLKDMHQHENPRLKNPLPPILLESMDTGRYNPTFLGISAVRPLTVGRGGKEGNQAFLKDQGSPSVPWEQMLARGVKKETIDAYVVTTGNNYLKSTIYEHIHDAVIAGQREIAGKLIEEAQKNGGYGFNELHKKVLQYNTQDLGTVLAASARKKPFANGMITPIHCACINPNAKYLEKLLAVEPDYNLEDKYGRKPIHFAAACEGSAPLEVLLKMGANPNDVSRKKVTPLLFACHARRAKNADLLIKRGQSDKDNPLAEKYGPGGLNQPGADSVCPIHVAVENADKDLLSVLLKYGVDVNKQLSAGKEKMTPLMIAAARGHLDMARRLVQSGAVVEKLDKFKRSALTHAVMNGNANVTSYLLYLGSDPNRKDSSGNSLVHYAAAYGWYFVLKLLVNEGGADASVSNDWQLTPLGAAFMKGHSGLVDFLLKLPGVDINFKNDAGMTLISVACSSQLSSELLPQIEYLLDKGADPTIPDVNGLNALHHLCGQTVYDAEELIVKIAQLLLKAGCSPKAKTTSRHTPIMIAIAQVNYKLVKFLVEKGGSITAETDKNGQNSLHLLAEKCLSKDLTPFLSILGAETNTSEIKENGLDEKMEVDGSDQMTKKPDNNVSVPSLKKEGSFKSTAEAIRQMATEVDHNGYTPLLIACKQYKEHCTGSSRHGHGHGIFFGGRNNSNENPQKSQEYGLSFIKTLLDTTGVSSSQCVQKKYIPDDQAVPEKEKARYSDSYCKYTPLHFMVSCNEKAKINEQFQGLKLIIEYKPDLEARNLNDETATVMAVKAQSADALKLLLEAGASANVSFREEPDSETNLDQKTLITVAARSSNVAMVRHLIAAKADVKNSRDTKTKQTALHAAVMSSASTDDKIALVGALIHAGADIGCVDKWKRTILHMAVSRNSGTSDASTDLEEFLIQSKANVFQKCALDRLPLHYAFDKIDMFGESSVLDPIELCAVLTSAMEDKKVDDMDKFGQTPLHLAAQRGASICCLHLVQRRAELNRKDHNSNTPLALAVSKGHDSCAIVLIQKGAEVAGKVELKPLKVTDEEVTEVTKTVVRPAWRWKPTETEEKEQQTQLSIFEESIKRELQGVSHMILDAGGIDASAIEAALNVKKFNVAIRLLRRVKDASKFHRLNNKRQNLLHVLGMNQGSTASILKIGQMLVQKGVPLNQTDQYGCTPLHYVALNRQEFEVAKFYTDNDRQLDVNKKDNFDRDVMAAYLWKYSTLTLSEDTKKWLKLLISKGASLNNLYDFPLLDVPLFDCLSSDIPDYFTTTRSNKISPLIMAINVSSFSLAKYFLENGASPNFADSQGLTPLMHAVKKNDSNMVRLLLDPTYEPPTTEQTYSGVPGLTKSLSRPVFQMGAVPFSIALPNLQTSDGDVSSSRSDKGDDEDIEEDSVDDDGISIPEEGSVVEEEESDADTDVVDEEEKEETLQPFPTLIKLQSIQPLRNDSTKSSKDSAVLVEKTSQVNVNATDTQGWTVLHHLVSPLDVGTFDNVELLNILVKVGADHQKKDNAGLSPLNHALIKGAVHLAEELQTLANVEKEKIEKPTYSKASESPDPNLTPKVDYAADCEGILKQIQESAMETETTKEENKVKPDPNCNIKDVAEVLLDESQSNIPFNALLSKVDVSYGAYGLYNFYIMQLLHQRGLDLYVLFTRWGRIGSTGQYQHTAFQKKEEAIAEFTKLFKSKTANLWTQLKAFEKHPKKYRLVQWEPKYGKSIKTSLTLKSDIPSKLPDPIQNLLSEMTNVSMMEAAMRKAGIEEELGNLKKEHLLEARRILQQIGELIRDNTKIMEGGNQHEQTAKYQSNCEEIASLSSDYYSLVPVENYAYERLPPIDGLEELKSKLTILHDLLDVECASQILLGAQAKINSVNPLDYVYQAMQCRIQPLTEDSVEAQYILKYIYGSCNSFAVHAIHKLSREGEEDRIRDQKLDNHFLLWHGTSVANVISILHRGLLVAPPEVPITGHLFGQGIYTSDAFSKSLMYCYNPNPKSNTKLALLCEVALGECMVEDNLYDRKEVELSDTEYNSRNALGQYIPNKDYCVTLPSGCMMPLGMLQDTLANNRRYMYNRVRYNEFIVENPAQVCLRYLVEISAATARH